MDHIVLSTFNCSQEHLIIIVIVFYISVNIMQLLCVVLMFLTYSNHGDGKQYQLLKMQDL